MVFASNSETSAFSFRSSLAQPFILDYNGNLGVSILGYEPDSKELLVWQLGTANFTKIPANLVDKEINKNACQVSHPHSSAFIDLDGDCLAGSPISCRYLSDMR